MANVLEKNESPRMRIPTSGRLGIAACGVLAANFGLAEFGATLVHRLALLVTFVVLCIAGVEAYLERKHQS